MALFRSRREREREMLRRPEAAARARRELADLDHTIERGRRAVGGPDWGAIAHFEERRAQLLDYIDYAEVRGKYSR